MTQEQPAPNANRPEARPDDQPLLVPPDRARHRWRRNARRLLAGLEGVVVVGSLATIALSFVVIAVLAFDENRGEQWTSGLRPSHFYKEFEADLLDDYAEVFSVAHNSGDGIGATIDALSYDADVIEVDVVSVNGRLYAAHDAPFTWLGDRFFRGPPLEQIWVVSSSADAIKLDLKESSPAFYDLVIQFLEQRRGPRRVIVVTNDAVGLQRFATEAPDALRFLSIGTEAPYAQLESNEALRDLIDGVSIRHSLLTEERAAWLEEQKIFTLAWTVNDMARVNELVLMGVDAVTTDNLAIMKLLGGQQRGERRLERLRTPPLLSAPATAIASTNRTQTPR